MLGAVAAVVFVYYGAARGVNEGQALFLADQLERRSFSAGRPTGVSLADGEDGNLVS